MDVREESELQGLLEDLGVGPGIRRLLPDEAELLPYLLKDVPGKGGVELRARWYARLFGRWVQAARSARA